MVVVSGEGSTVKNDEVDDQTCPLCLRKVRSPCVAYESGTAFPCGRLCMPCNLARGDVLTVTACWRRAHWHHEVCSGTDIQRLYV